MILDFSHYSKIISLSLAYSSFQLAQQHQPVIQLYRCARI